MPRGLEVDAGRKAAAARALLGVGAAAVIVALVPALAFATETAECQPPLRALFSCMAGAKTISICGSADLTTSGGLLQYRFGPPSAAELIYPSRDADWRAVTRAATL